MMRHCRQCRADAVGLLGEDRSAEFTTDKIMEMEVNYDIDTRQAYQDKVEEERAGKGCGEAGPSLQTLAGEMSDVKILIAVATKGWWQDQRTFRSREGVPGLRAEHGRREIRRPPARRPVLPGWLRRRGQSRRRSSARSTTALRCSSLRSEAVRRPTWRRPASSQSINTRTSSSSNRRSPSSRTIWTGSKAAKSSTSCAATPTSVRARSSPAE